MSTWPLTALPLSGKKCTAPQWQRVSSNVLRVAVGLGPLVKRFELSGEKRYINAQIKKNNNGRLNAQSRRCDRVVKALDSDLKGPWCDRPPLATICGGFYC